MPRIEKPVPEPEAVQPPVRESVRGRAGRPAWQSPWAVAAVLVLIAVTTGVTFLGSQDVHAIAYADGNLQYAYGADGAGTLQLTGVESGLTTRDGGAIKTNVAANGNLIQGLDSSGNLVFEIRLTPATGKWEFYQYQPMNGTANDLIDFTYQVKDADGDFANGQFQVGGVEPTGPTLTIADNNAAAPGVLSVSEAQATGSGSFLITAAAGLKSISIDGTGVIVALGPRSGTRDARARLCSSASACSRSTRARSRCISRSASASA